MSRFAQGTSVPVDRSESEIKRTLLAYKADDIASGQSQRLNEAFVQFRFRGLPVRVVMPLPDRQDKRFRETPRRRRHRNEHQANAEWERACRQQWRVLLLLIKAQLEAIENKMIKPEEAFLPWLMLPNGETVGQAIASRIAQLSDGESVQKLLPFPTEVRP